MAKKVALQLHAFEGEPNDPDPSVLVKFTPPIIPRDIRAKGYQSFLDGEGTSPVSYGIIQTNTSYSAGTREKTDIEMVVLATDRNGEEDPAYYDQVPVMHPAPISTREFLRGLGYELQVSKDATLTKMEPIDDLDARRPEAFDRQPRGMSYPQDDEPVVKLTQRESGVAMVSGALGAAAGLALGMLIARSGQSDR